MDRDLFRVVESGGSIAPDVDRGNPPGRTGWVIWFAPGVEPPRPFLEMPVATARRPTTAPTPRIALVSTVRAFAAAHRAEFLTDDVIGDLADRALFIHDARHRNTLFDALPESGETGEDAEYILDELEDFAAESADELAALLGPGPKGRKLEWGLHAEAAYEDVVAQLRRDGFEIKGLPGVG
jgi:hypothetical protein